MHMLRIIDLQTIVDIFNKLTCSIYYTHTTVKQGAYKSGKPGNLREFCKSGKLREFEMYSQRQKCRPMTLVSENIRFMQIFAGVPLGGRQTTFDIVQEICQNDCYGDSLHRVFA